MRLLRDPSQCAAVPLSLGAPAWLSLFPFLPRPPPRALAWRWSPGTARSGRSAGAAAAPAPSNGTRPALLSLVPVDERQGRSVPRAKGAGITIPGPTANRSRPRVPRFPGKRRQLGNGRTAYGERMERARKAQSEGRSRSSLRGFPSPTAQRLVGFHRGCCMSLKIKCCEGLVADRKL